MVGFWSSGALLLIATAAIQSVRADTPSGRANHGCVLLRATIYCYGGATRTTTGTTTALSSNLFYSLDVSEEKNITDLAGSWTEYTSGNVGSNYYFAMTAVPKLNSFVIDGGRGTGQSGYTTQAPTVTFNATGSGSWNTGINPGGHPLVDSHQAVSDNSSIVYLCGGRSEQYTNTEGPMQFPTQMTLFNTPLSTWSSTPATLRSVSSQTRLHHKATLGIDGQTIYYVGGIYPASPIDASGTGYYYGHVNMTEILIYNTAQASWRIATTTGTVIPAPRMDHTLTTKPSTGELIVYGGTQLDSSLPVDDYFYILDTQSMSWSNRTLGSTDGAQGAGARHGHAAVLAGNSTLFIIFGSTGDSDSALSALDIDNWSWLNTVPAVVVPPSDNDHQEGEGGTPGSGGSQDGSGSQDSGSSISAGTIAGAVVGAVAGVAIIGAIVFFFLRRRRNKNSETVATNDDDDAAAEAAAARRLKALEAEHSAPPYTDLEPPTSHQFLPAYNSTTAGKPDGSTSSVSDGQVQRIVMQPVKPDGA